MKEPLIQVDNDSRTIEFMGDITADSISKLMWEFRKFLIQDDKDESEKKNFKRKPIHFHINSYGGTVYDGNALLSLMLSSKTPIYTYCDGYCMSMGLILYLAGSKRFAGKYVRFMYHQISTSVKGMIESCREDLIESDILNTQLMKFVSERTQFDYDTLVKINASKDNCYFGYDFAVSTGVVTEGENDGRKEKEIANEEIKNSQDK